MPRNPTHVCIDCGEARWGALCFPCRRKRREAAKSNALASAVPVGDGTRRNNPRNQYARHRRDRLAPGLSEGRRRLLRDKWRREGRACIYCGAPGVTVDHVVPLRLGGTNYEGNLAPACWSCNCSKSDLLVAEWRLANRKRTAKRPKLACNEPEPRRTFGPSKMVGRQLEWRECPICQSLFQPQTVRSISCGRACAVELQARYMRDKYRASVGLPVDPRRPRTPHGTMVRKRWDYGPTG